MSEVFNNTLDPVSHFLMYPCCFVWTAEGTMCRFCAVDVIIKFNSASALHNAR